jgi:hypothetical protein
MSSFEANHALLPHRIPRGGTWTLTVSLFDEDGTTPLDMTGATIEWYLTRNGARFLDVTNSQADNVNVLSLTLEETNFIGKGELISEITWSTGEVQPDNWGAYETVLATEVEYVDA